MSVYQCLVIEFVSRESTYHVEAQNPAEAVDKAKRGETMWEVRGKRGEEVRTRQVQQVQLLPPPPEEEEP